MLELSLSEDLLSQVFERWWSSSVLGAPLRLALTERGVLGSASAHMPCPRVQLREAHGGRLAFACRAKVELSWLPGLSRELSCEWLLLVEPWLVTEVAQGSEAASITIAADFSESTIESLQAHASDRWMGLSVVPPGLEPFSEWRLKELGRFAVEKLLDRVGTQRLSLDATRLLEVLATAGHRPDSLELRVETGRLVIGLPRAPTAEARVPAATTLELLGAPGERARDAAPALAAIGRPVVERLLRSKLEQRLPAARFSPLSLEPREHGFDVRVVVRPAHARWPERLGLPLRARLHLVSVGDRFRVELDALSLELRGRPLALPAWLVQRIGARLSQAGSSRHIESPSVTSLAGRLRIERIQFEPGLDRIAIELAREPEAGRSD